MNPELSLDKRKISLRFHHLVWGIFDDFYLLDPDLDPHPPCGSTSLKRIQSSTSFSHLLALQQEGLEGEECEGVRHILEYPPGPRGQQLIQLLPPTLTLQVGHVLLLHYGTLVQQIKKSRRRKNTPSREVLRNRVREKSE